MNVDKTKFKSQEKGHNIVIGEYTVAEVKEYISHQISKGQSNNQKEWLSSLWEAELHSEKYRCSNQSQEYTRNDYKRRRICCEYHSKSRLLLLVETKENKIN